MILDIRKIGNAKGIIIPKNILSQCGFSEKVKIEIVGDQLILKQANDLREGWESAFEKASVDDASVENVINHFDNEEWTW